jgi:hypothetical protein
LVREPTCAGKAHFSELYCDHCYVTSDADYHSVYFYIIFNLAQHAAADCARLATSQRRDPSHIFISYAQDDRFCGMGKRSSPAPVENAEIQGNRKGEQKANTYFALDSPTQTHAYTL